jgi:hypothetical protein
MIGIAAGVAVLAAAAGILVYVAVGEFEVALPEPLTGGDPGELVKVTRFGSYPEFVVQGLLDRAGLPEPFEVRNGIEVYRIEYRTTNHDGTVVTASGLLSIPKRDEINGVIAYFHGTNAQRDTAPSQPGIGEGLFVAAAAAGQGHVLLAPDYIGLGESHEIHPYLHAETTTTTCIDFLEACHAFVVHTAGGWPSALFLTGFSQGGHTTFLIQRELEEMADPRFQVRSTAPIAGPFHLRDVSLPQAMTGETDSHQFYLAYLSHAYAHIYGRPLDSLLVEPYVQTVPVLFDGNHDWEDFTNGLPDHPRKLFRSEFLEAFDAGGDHWFLDALALNGAYDWTPAAPVRVYYGDKDIDVLPEEALRAVAAMSERGADITAISVGPYDHNHSAMWAIPRAIRWFDELIESQS